MSGLGAKKILIFSTAYLPFVGGAEIAVKEITYRLKDFEFDIITLNLDGEQKNEEVVGNVRIFRVGGSGKLSKFLFPFTAYSLAKRLHIERNYDVVWSIMASYSGFAARFFKKQFPNVPFILTLQEGDPIPEVKRKVRFVSGWFREIFTLADSIQVISNYLAEWARLMGAKSVTVVPNGVDVNVFNREISRDEKENIKNLIFKKEGDIFLVTTGRLVYKNATDDIISALKGLPQNISLVVIGKGEEEEKLLKQAENFKVKNRVKFLGFIPYEEIPKYFSVCDIFIRPSRSEGFGNSFIEAMASKLPVIATPVGGIPDFLIDKETGVFCDVDNPESIARVVNLILSDSDLKNRIVKNAYNMVEEKYSWEKIAKDMASVFDKVS